MNLYPQPGTQQRDAGELGCKAYTCLDEIWRQRADAVIICTPASTHWWYTLRPYAGKHVPCEKPRGAMPGRQRSCWRLRIMQKPNRWFPANQRWLRTPHKAARESRCRCVIGICAECAQPFGDWICPWMPVQKITMRQSEVLSYLLI